MYIGDSDFDENLFTLNEVIYIVIPTAFQIAQIYLDEKKKFGACV